MMMINFNGLKRGGRMKTTMLIFLCFFLFVSDGFAHSGRTNSCGGHNNRKTGGYHIHNYTKYYNCYPEKKAGTQKKKALTCDEKIEAACEKALKKCLDVCEDRKCKDACLAGKVACE